MQLTTCRLQFTISETDADYSAPSGDQIQGYLMKRQKQTETAPTTANRNGRPGKIRIRVRNSLLFLAALLLLIIGASITFDIMRLRPYTPSENVPEFYIPRSTHIMLSQLTGDGSYNSELVPYIAEVLNSRYESGDFELLSLLRIFYSHGGTLSGTDRSTLRKAILGYKYWMEDPGTDNLYFWSESRQILFAVAEYLAGNLFPDMIFTNAQLTGREHMVRSRKRITTWLRQRWEYGFSAGNSAESYADILAALGCLMDFTPESELLSASRIITDLIIHDIAIGSAAGNFSGAAGSAPATSRISPQHTSLQPLVDSLLKPADTFYSEPGLFQNFMLCRNYDIPKVLGEIARSGEPGIYLSNQGINLRELAREGAEQPAAIMQQFGMQAYTQPAVINKTVSYLSSHELFHNRAFYGLRYLDFTLLKLLGLLPAVSRIGNPDADRSLLHPATIYTYRGNGYTLSSLQRYAPGERGDRQMIWQADFGEGAVVFANSTFEQNDTDLTVPSPYWDVSDLLPDTVQHDQVVMSMYQNRDQFLFLGDKRLPTTHLYLPEKHFDEVIVSSRSIFARKNSSFIAVISRNPLTYRQDSDGSRFDLIQQGADCCWIIETSDAHAETFTGFMQRIGNNRVIYEDAGLTYTSGGAAYVLAHNGAFTVDGESVELPSLRYQSPYAAVNRFPESMEFSTADNSLYVNFSELQRTTTGPVY